jgi:hypothetical protein
VGVVYWDDLIEKLYANDPETARAITANFRWSDQILHVKDSRQSTRGHGFSINRQRLIGTWQPELRTRRQVEFGREVGSLVHWPAPN